MDNRIYVAIDLKSFYASVECMDRGLDPLTTNLVVADKSRTDKTIVLAVSPSLKAYGIPGRPRLFEVVQKVSTDIYKIYLKYVAPEHIHVYSIDEVFMDVTEYLKLHRMTARDLAIKIISDGDLNYRAVVYRNDEIGDITSGMNEMVDRLNFTLNELMSSQQHANAMSKLATMDALTGVRDKTAFDGQTKQLSEELARGETAFGFAMLDLNNLKVINDNYGHEKGDVAIRKVCSIICDVFLHSPMFRVGGDEFVVILKGVDYQYIDQRVMRFQHVIRLVSADKGSPPWERVSAAIGYALYDKALDSGIDSVLVRADKEMYQCKKKMKST